MASDSESARQKKAKRVREESGLSQSLFAPSTHSVPIQATRRPVPGAQSKLPMPADEIAEAVREWKEVEEAETVEKSAADSEQAEAAEAVRKVKAGGRIDTVDQAEAIAGLWALSKGYE